MAKSSPEIYITLDQFKVLASRIKAKENFIKSKVESWQKFCHDYVESFGYGYDWSEARFSELLDMLSKPADFYVLSSDVDMSEPSVVKPSQLDLFGEEFC